jgi:hypothetical protein
MQDKFDNIVFDVTIPPGEFSTVTRSGWQQHEFPAGITTQYRNPGAVVPLINGIKKVKLVLRTGSASRSSACAARVATTRSPRARRRSA